jgi:hypothetical protein
MPQQQPLGGIQAAAAAMNPQFAPILMQQANAPAQARYQQQQAAFEAAMQGQQHALAAGTQLIGQGSKEDIARMMEQGKQGQDAIANQLRMLGLQIQMQNAKTSETKANKPTPQGYVPVYDIEGNTYFVPKPTSGGPQAAILPGGGQAVNPAAADKRQAAASGLDSLQSNMDEMRALYQSGAGNYEKGATPSTGITTPGEHGMPERGFQSMMSGLPVIGSAASALDPTAKRYYQLRSQVLLQLNKPVSGQGRLLQAEIEQFKKALPDYADLPATAIPAFDQLQSMITKMRSKYPGSTSPSDPAPTGRKTAAQLADEMGLK